MCVFLVLNGNVFLAIGLFLHTMKPPTSVENSVSASNTFPVTLLQYFKCKYCIASIQSEAAAAAPVSCCEFIYHPGSLLYRSLKLFKFTTTAKTALLTTHSRLRVTYISHPVNMPHHHTTERGCIKFCVLHGLVGFIIINNVKATELGTDALNK